MRYVATGIAVGATVALLMSLHATSHALPAPLKKPWSSWTLAQKKHYVKANLAHARGAIAWIKTHPRFYRHAGRLIRQHRRLEAKATRNLAAIEAKLHPKPTFPEWFLALVDCESGDGTGTPPYVLGWTYNDGLYHGGINFLISTWLTYGGGRYAPVPEQASPWEQYLVTLAMHRDVPWSQSNPACSARIGL